MTPMSYRTDAGVVTALVLTPGRKWLPIITLGCPIKIRKVALAEQRFMTPLDYPVKRAVRKYIAAGRRLGITKGARKALREVLS